MKRVNIGKQAIGPGEPTFVIAEAGVNYNGSLKLALEHIKKAKEAGADAIKFQTYTPERLVTKKAARYWTTGDKHVKTQLESFTKFAQMSMKEYKEMLAYAKKLDIVLFSTPFELEAVDLLESVSVPAYKIASADITYFPLLKKVAKTKKPIIMSVGAATIGEAEEAVNYIRSFGNNKIILLHCILSYPTDQKDANLLMIDGLQKAFPDIPIGLSDHTFSPLTPALAVMRGAKVVEKHFTIDNSLPDNPDHDLGVNPKGMRELVDAVRLAEISLGSEHKEPIKSEEAAKREARRSITALVDIPKDTKITTAMIIGKRPGTGIPTKFQDIVIGRKATRNIPADTTLTWEMV